MSGRENEFAPWLGVFETVRVVEGRPLFVDEHLAELRRATRAVGLTAPDAVVGGAELSRRTGRWRWIVTRSGLRTMFTDEAEAAPGMVDLRVAAVRVGSMNWDARFKTLSYLTHAQARREAAPAEAILLNERGEVTSGSRANLFWRRGERIYTPAHETGCRCGVVRGFVLQRRRVEQGHFSLEELLGAEEIFLTNSMRGIVSAQGVEGRAVEQCSLAEELRAELGSLNG